MAESEASRSPLALKSLIRKTTTKINLTQNEQDLLARVYNLSQHLGVKVDDQRLRVTLSQIAKQGEVNDQKLRSPSDSKTT